MTTKGKTSVGFSPEFYKVERLFVRVFFSKKDFMVFLKIKGYFYIAEISHLEFACISLWKKCRNPFKMRFAVGLVCSKKMQKGPNI